MHPTREQRLEELRLEFAARFEPLCRDMSAKEFATLVDHLASFRMKYDEAGPEPDQRPAAGG